MSIRPQPILVAACGNPMAGDDAFGPLLAQSLQRNPIPGVEVADLRTNPSGLLDVLEGHVALVIADAAIAPDMAPGTVIDCDWHSTCRAALVREDVTSTHGLTIRDQIELARTVGILPATVRLIAVAAACPGSAASSSPRKPSQSVIDQLGPAREHIAQLARDVATRSLTEMSYV